MRKWVVFLLCMLLIVNTYAQKQGNIWYFGYKAGLDFNSGKPVELKNGQLSTDEGCSSISDTRGQLLFYTDGISIWNRKHKTMPNGTGLAGNTSATQSGVIVPLKGDTNIYYVFTVDMQGGKKGIEYSIVDMSADKGNGDVISKNNFLYGPTCEKVTATPMADGSGYWVISHQYGSDTFVTYQLTQKGLSKNIVKSKSGPVVNTITNVNSIGYLTVSPDGTKLGMANYQLKDLELFDFDNATGRVYNATRLKTGKYDYGCAFSADSKVFYACQFSIPKGETSHVQQYDLTAWNIPASEYDINTGDTVTYGALQLGPDDKIYVVRAGDQYLDVIENPGELGSACNYTFRSVYFASGTVALGLPNSPPFVFKKVAINALYNCYLDTSHFYASFNLLPDSFIWTISPPNGTKQIYKNQNTLNKVLKDTGTYKVVLQAYKSATIYSDSITLHIAPTPGVNLGRDTFLCGNVNLLLSGPAGFTTYTWQDGSTKQSLSVQKTGKYWLKARNGSCIKSDTINVVNINPNLKKINTLDTTICTGSSLNVNMSQAGCKYLWNDADTLATRKISKAGKYTVKVYNACTAVYDTVKVKLTDIVAFDLGRDTMICKGANYTLHAPDSFSYLWQDGSKQSSLKVTKAGKYSVSVFEKCGIVKDSINISYYPDAPAPINKDTLICPDRPMQVDISKAGFSYLWDDGSTLPKRTFNTAGIFSAKVSNTCGYVMDTFKVKVDLPLVYKHWHDTVICKEAGLTLYAPDSLPGIWQDGSLSTRMKVTKAGKYMIRIYRKCEVVTDSINVGFYPDIKPMHPVDTTICFGKTVHCDYTRASAVYTWNDGYNKSVRDIKTPGLYYCRANNQCYKATDTIKVQVQHPIKLSLGHDTTLCPHITLLLQAPDSAIYKWQDGSHEQTMLVSKAGLYKVSVSNICGSVSDSIQVGYIAPFAYRLPNDTALCDGDSLAINAYSIPGKYSWNNGNEGSKIMIKQAGTHILTFQNRCEIKSDTINITIDSFCNCYLYTPDIFSPDNNMINDIWKPSSCSRYKSYSLEVYNRWGERVFTSNDLNQGWDGNFKGAEAIEGMYIYLIKIIDVHNNNNYKSGRFYLIRN